MALTDKLSAIGEAIRYKTETTELLSLDAMPAAIESIETGTPPMLYNRIDSNEDGSFTLTDLESKTHTLVPTYAENGDVVAVQLDDYEMIPVTHNADGYMTGIFLTTTDFTNVQIEEEEVAAIYASVVANEDGTSSFTDKDGVVHTLTPITIDENGAITAVQFDGEDIPLTYDDNGALITIGDTTTVDFSNVIVDEEAAGEEDFIATRFVTNFMSMGGAFTNTSFYNKNYPNDIIPMSKATGGTLKLDCELEGTKPTGAEFCVCLQTYKEDGSSTNSTIKLLSYTSGTTMSTDGIQEISYDLSKITSTAVNGRIYAYIKGGGSTNNSGSANGILKISNIRIEEVTA
jgi:hypothetical protein